MGVERKGLDGFTIYPRAGHIYAGNRLPVAVRANSGFWRRWLVIEYDRVFAGTSSDRDVLGAIEAELPDIIAHAIRAFLDTGGRGGRGFTEPACHRALMGQWETISDSVAAFRDDCIRPVPDEWSKVRWPLRSQVHRAYRDWCEQVGRKPVSAGEFYSRLEAYGFASSKVEGRRVLPVVLDMSEID
jgi:phage/plasmid-associated DNA primase